ncbi:MAG: hypothetical protein ACR2QH_15120 [Geminicoccaceae bacterium]
MNTSYDIRKQNLGDGLTIPIGLVPGYTSGDKFGINPDVDTGTTPEDVWSSGGTYTGFPDGAAETVEVFSDNAADTSAGTGARTIRLIGLDVDFNEQTEDVTLNGLTAVPTVNTWKRLSRAFILTAGSGGTNAGAITGRHTVTTANVFFSMPAGDGQTLVCCTTVPAGKTMLVKHAVMSIASNLASGAADLALRVREPGGVFRKRRQFTVNAGGSTEVTYLSGVLIPEKSDLKMTVEAVSANNTSIAAELEFYLVDQ